MFLLPTCLPLSVPLPIVEDSCLLHPRILLYWAQQESGFQRFLSTSLAFGGRRIKLGSPHPSQFRLGTSVATGKGGKATSGPCATASGLATESDVVQLGRPSLFYPSVTLNSEGARPWVSMDHVGLQLPYGTRRV
jgi:hypothetical protein